MSSIKPIGGYFGLELPDAQPLPYEDGVFLNSGRACFEYILRTKKPSKVYLPIFTCDVMLEPLKHTHTPYELYSIKDNLELADDIEIGSGELLIYTNYFGIKDDYCQKLAERYKNCLLLDYSQAFYSPPPAKVDTFYSPRKFFGIPDGGVLRTLTPADLELPVDQSYGRSVHLLKRLDIGAEAAYEDFKHDDASLIGEPIKQMSNLTKELLASIDHEAARQKRVENYHFLHQHLASRNGLSVPSSPVGPLCYPLLASSALRTKLISQKVFVPTYWPNVREWAKPGTTEYNLCDNIVALPIDQRYDTQDMERILEIINE